MSRGAILTLREGYADWLTKLKGDTLGPAACGAGSQYRVGGAVYEGLVSQQPQVHAILRSVSP